MLERKLEARASERPCWNVPPRSFRIHLLCVWERGVGVKQGPGCGGKGGSEVDVCCERFAWCGTAKTLVHEGVDQRKRCERCAR